MSKKAYGTSGNVYAMCSRSKNLIYCLLGKMGEIGQFIWSSHEVDSVGIKYLANSDGKFPANG